jgi:hypothetical protein
MKKEASAMFRLKKLTVLSFVAIMALALTISLTPVHAQKHGGRSSGHSGESAHSDGGGCSSCGGDEGDEGHGKGGKGGRGQRGGHHTGDAGRGQSLRDIFHGLEGTSDTEHAGTEHEAH